MGKARVWRYRVDIAASGPALPAEWGEPAAPLVYVSFGSVAGSLGRFDALYPAILEILADLPIRVLITTGGGYDAACLEPLPDNAWAAQWWPQAAAMRGAVLVIGHGGFGTTMTAVAAGVPQLLLPLFSSDQLQNAERVEAVGVGARLLGGLDAVPDVPGVVRELLDPGKGYIEAARRIAADMAALPNVRTTVAVLEGLAS
jgi:UDP:flavonoid glycosyltransferase YjiC (YdhE family)